MVRDKASAINHRSFETSSNLRSLNRYNLIMKSAFCFVRHGTPMVCLMVVAGLLAIPVAVQAAEEDTERPELTDRQVYQALTQVERLQWERAERLVESGKDDIESGEWQLSRKESEMGLENDEERVERAHERGRELIAAGKAKIERGKEMLEQLRASVRDRTGGGQRPETLVLRSTVAAQEWDNPSAGGTLEPLRSRARSLLESLWNRGYQRIFPACTFVLREGQYEVANAFEERFRELLVAIDGDRYTVAENPPESYQLISSEAGLGLDFPERERVLRLYKTAIVVLEVIPRETGQSALLAMRAVDPANMRILSSDSVLIPLPAGLGGLLALDGENAPAASDAGAALEPLSASLTDSAGFIGRLRNSPQNYVFTVRFGEGIASSAEKREAVLLCKTLILENTELPLTDEDFALRAFEPSEGFEAPPRLADAAWEISREYDEQAGQPYHKVTAISFANEREVPVGRLTITTGGDGEGAGNTASAAR